MYNIVNTNKQPLDNVNPQFVNKFNETLSNIKMTDTTIPKVGGKRYSKRKMHKKKKTKVKRRKSTKRRKSYRGGWSQYMNNNGSVSHIYTRGGILAPENSALANPAPYKILPNATAPDNLNHFKLNSYGNSGSGSGFSSKGH